MSEHRPYRGNAVMRKHGILMIADSIKLIATLPQRHQDMSIANCRTQVRPLTLPIGSKKDSVTQTRSQVWQIHVPHRCQAAACALNASCGGRKARDFFISASVTLEGSALEMPRFPAMWEVTASHSGSVTRSSASLATSGAKHSRSSRCKPSSLR